MEREIITSAVVYKFIVNKKTWQSVKEITYTHTYL